MTTYTTYNLFNNPDPDIRPWPIMTAAQADDEIAKLRAHLAQERENNKDLRSLVKSLILANDELREVIRRAVKR